MYVTSTDHSITRGGATQRWEKQFCRVGRVLFCCLAIVSVFLLLCGGFSPGASHALPKSLATSPFRAVTCISGRKYKGKELRRTFGDVLANYRKAAHLELDLRVMGQSVGVVLFYPFAHTVVSVMLS